ncbi:hypothetical protein [Kaistella carnis]|uniref:hypothetical protein n=1 Tax=Kaistella carnis TaxID=1241979 RepID=UPI0028982087|nr:hypothetical protein [Kaistella carnis]
MEREKIINFLEKFDYRYSVKNQVIEVKLDFSQKVMIDLSETNKIKIYDELVGWNFLTGLLVMSLKNAIIYNFIISIISSFVFFYLQSLISSINFIPFYFVFILWLLMSIQYYVIKLENFKSRIMNLQE